MSSPGISMTVDEITDPAEASRTAARRARFERNLLWFERHALDIGARCRGKCICVAGEELFVADTPQEAVALARAAHPEDDGFFLHYIPKTATTRIYADLRLVAGVR
jgi:hypothetical protein